MPYKTFGFNEEQILMRDSILGLLGRVIPADKMLELDKESEFPEEAFQAMAKARPAYCRGIWRHRCLQYGHGGFHRGFGLSPLWCPFRFYDHINLWRIASAISRFGWTAAGHVTGID